ncbi:hypothetical protein GCM10007304_21610 [Rhodococcoides trifolii]|uniref:Smf/DprA SLOG domain-containing protein n=1 Tax=Rhodococcoides trifolii TaxID=908250 RepID=A0A917FWF1_9NOCA|nr:DNA-processing protein DprA [Rhodococcus trifolii]GGG07230.1 hypothetical protein GCM10007304_21610 [Rhodococcus trifolii]
MTAWETERVAWAYLSRVTQGPSRVVSDFVERYGVVEAVRAIKSGVVPRVVAERVSARAHIDTAAADLDAVAALGGRLVIPTDDEWPAWRLVGFQTGEFGGRADTSVPLALWVIGGRSLLDVTERAVAVVGTRAATAYGEHVAGEISGDMAVDGWTVVSGGAFGIDGVAHRAAMGVGGVTVAVLACGVDRAYPAGHARLLQQITSSGLVVSEYALGTTPAKHRFLARNRLVAAFGEGVVVVEAGWRSGARNTASWARSLGRPVVAVPGPVTSASSAGCHRMIRESEARLVSNARDVVEEIGSALSGDDEQDHLFSRGDDRITGPAILVLDALPGSGSLGPHEISELSGVPMSDVRAALVMLEMESLVVRDDTGWARAQRRR